MSETITVTGNIATDPESRASGTITTFRLASTERRLNRESGNWEDANTNWYTVSAFRRLGGHALQSLHKGQRVIVTGRLRVREWQNATSKGTSVEITADAIGHDLLWGTSVFQRAGGGSTAASSGSTGWSVPGADESGDGWTPPLTSTSAPDTPESLLVDAGSIGRAYAAEETPF